MRLNHCVSPRCRQRRGVPAGPRRSAGHAARAADGAQGRQADGSRREAGPGPAGALRRPLSTLRQSCTGLRGHSEPAQGSLVTALWLDQGPGCLCAPLGIRTVRCAGQVDRHRDEQHWFSNIQGIISDRHMSGTPLQGEASEAMECAAAAMGVLHVIGSHVSRGSYWQESYHTSAAPSFLALLTSLLPCQPRLHPKVAGPSTVTQLTWPRFGKSDLPDMAATSRVLPRRPFHRLNKCFHVPSKINVCGRRKRI